MWQTIDKAPRDGTPVLGWDGEDMATVRWYVGGDHPSLQWWDLIVSGTYADDGEWHPSHWAPLPDPPIP